MKSYASAIVWFIATILLASAFIIGHHKERKIELDTVYRCYNLIYMKKGIFMGTERPFMKRSVLEQLTPGSIYEDLTVSKQVIEPRSIEIVFYEKDNPTIKDSKITCFK